MHMSAPKFLLEVRDLSAGYDGRDIVQSVSLTVSPGEIISIIGHNGAGKSTLFKAIFGVIPASHGETLWAGVPVSKRSPRNWRSLGMAYVPQGGRVFLPLSVEENLQIAALAVGANVEGSERELIDHLFPALKAKVKKRASTLSGGERQMLALACSLLGSPRLLLLDEPSLGIAGNLVSEIFSLIHDLCRLSALSVILIEHKVKRALEISNRAYVIRRGTVVFTGNAGDLLSEQRLREVYF